ncbi:hypothetical protein [Luteithermobacter gelatinilyticus]|uniref:hypothetical protein n=1 Tax=Luteithermobacter gelatinilyticus TaxID=2582913 RepID=UPI001107288D|nr:hypothetical protein [Luteithermobacter gelatinilyticus]|tara:strand:+ start:11367 stop:11636 length:270 start_codon:yes stop_codon:yes gene_type:complete
MLKASELTLTAIRQELDRISAEMLTLIQTYQLEASSSLEIISVAREKITNEKDYIRFLELSLEGRIYGEAAEALEKATVSSTSSQNTQH